MATIVKNVFSERRLQFAWKETQKRDAEDGIIAPSIRRFAENAEERIEALRIALATNIYQPHPFVEFNINTNGKERTLHIPAVEDRIVARAILTATTPIIDPLLGGSAFGYRPGLGVADAVQTIVEARETGLRWVLRTDVDECFPTLPPQIAFKRFEKAVADSKISAVVQQLLNRTVANGKLNGKILPGLPLGCPLSPILMNLVLVDLDDALNEAGFTVIRYADDIVVLGDSRQDLEDAMRFGQRLLRKFDMRLGEDKTEIMTFDDGFAFLGEDFGPKYPPFLPLQHVPNPEDRVLYIGAQTARLRISKGRLIVEEGDKKKVTKILDVPSSQVTRIVVFGSVGVSAGVRSWAAYHGIDIVLASRRGAYIGSIVGSQTSPHAARLMAQVNIQGSDHQVRLSREIVRAKIQKQIVVLQRFGKRCSEEYINTAVTRMRTYMGMLDDAQTLDEVRGLEGAAAKEYFLAYGSLFPKDLVFTKRSRRPPKDVANAALSFLYTVLLSECITAVRAAGMEPTLGVLHNPQEKRPSLALDLLEELRPLVVDQVVLSAARRKLLSSQHSRKDEGRPGVLLTKKGREQILNAYEARMLQVVKGSLPNFAGSIRRHMYRQAQRLAGAIVDEEYQWTGMSWRR